MKKILITGACSYIGTSFEKYINDNFAEEYKVETLDLLDENWEKKDFASFDIIFHVAGIVHIKENKNNEGLYYKINRDLTYKIALKAKESGVKQFIFLSTMSVYGVNCGVITKDTVPNPKSNYGKSKLQAEEKLNFLQDESFNVVILRPPMVYGKDCKGNFQFLVKMAKKLPIFPYVNNKRSLIYVDNLCSFVKMAIDKNLKGIYFPQNKEFVTTSKMVKVLRNKLGKKIFISRVLGLCVIICMPFITKIKKAFGSLVYENTEQFNFEYCVKDFNESVRESI